MLDGIREFGLDPCDLSTMISNIAVMLRIQTLNVDSRCKKRIPIICYILTYVCFGCYYYCYLVSMLWFLFVRNRETGNLVAAMVVMSLGVSSETAIFKHLFMFKSRKRLRRIVAEYLECDALTTLGSRFALNMAKSLKPVKKKALGFWILLMANALAYNLMPVFIPGRHLQEDFYVIYGLEPMFESPNYEIALFLTGISVTFICFISANMTAFMIIIVGYTEAQMLSLSEEILNVWDDSLQETYINTNLLKIEVISNLFQNTKNKLTDEETKNINREVKKRLVQLIKNHSRNIRLLCQIEDIYRISIAIEFVLLIVGLIAELLGGLKNTFLEIPFSISQVAIDCWTAQRVMDASVSFEQAVYACKWENFDRHNMKIVLVMLQCSQRTLTLSAGGMTMLSFSCLMSILRSIYSSYTTLRSMI